jgi:hypothetical protein
MNKQDEIKQILIDMAYTGDAKPRFINEKWVNITDGRNLQYIDEATEKILKLMVKTPEDIAYEILCTDDDYTIDEMITAIEEQDKIDGGLFIDYVDGVSVWQKMELEFTCDDFLTYIGLKS